MTHLGRLKVHVVVPYLKKDRYEVDEWDVVAAPSAGVCWCRCPSRIKAAHVSDSDRAIMSLTAMRNSPPVSDPRVSDPTAGVKVVLGTQTHCQGPCGCTPPPSDTTGCPARTGPVLVHGAVPAVPLGCQSSGSPAQSNSPVTSPIRSASLPFPFTARASPRCSSNSSWTAWK